MKKLFLLPVMIFSALAYVSAYTDHNLESAIFLSSRWIINDNSLNPTAYNLDFNITRREMLKVMMNLSWNTVTDSCSGAFSDLSSSDWGCKYAEAALAAWYIAWNSTFRPNDNVTQIEALKMIMQAKWIQRDDTTDWRVWYVSKAYSEGLLDENYLTYNDNAIRGWIFSTSAKSYEDFEYKAPDIDLDPEIEELFQELLNL